MAAAAAARRAEAASAAAYADRFSEVIHREDRQDNNRAAIVTPRRATPSTTAATLATPEEEEEDDTEEGNFEEGNFDGSLNSYLSLPVTDQVAEDSRHQLQVEEPRVDPEEEEEERSFLSQPSFQGRDQDQDFTSRPYSMDHYKIVNKNSCQGLPSNSKSTALLYKRVHIRYCVFALTVDLDSETKQPLVSKLWSVVDKDVNRFLVRQFVDFYVTTQQTPGKGHITEALVYLQRRIDDEMQECGRISRKGLIREDTSWIAQYTKRFLIEKAVANKAGFKDVQSQIESRIPRWQELALIDFCYTPTKKPSFKLLTRSNVASGFAHAGQAGTRGSDARSLNFHHGFTKEMEYLGNGAEVDHFVHNQGKTNRTGRIEYKAFATHRNPRLDASAHLGLSLLLRFNVLHEPFPDFLNPKDYATRPVYRSAKSYQKGISKSTMYDNWKFVYEAVGISCKKVTHQPRVDLQQRIADKGCAADTIERFCGYATAGKKMNDKQRESYLFCPPVQAVAAAADGDPSSPGSHQPGWNVSIPLGPDGELVSLCPWLYSELAKVQDAYDQASDKQRLNGCLYQALGSLKAFKRRIEHAVKLLASLPLDAKNILMPLAEPIHIQWQSYPVLHHDFFSSTRFEALVTLVQTGQKQEALLLSGDLSQHQKSSMQREFTDRITPGIQQNIRTTQSALVNIERLQATLEGGIKLLLQFVQPSTACTIEKDVPMLSPLDLTSKKILLQKVLTSVSSGIEHQHQPTYDKTVTTKGNARKRAPHQSIQNGPFSTLNLTAIDYWMEYKYGRNQGVPLEQLEADYGSKWRSDSVYTRSDGSTGTALKSAWSLQKPIYEFIEYLIREGRSEEEALLVVQEMFDQNAWKSGKPKLQACAKLFRQYMSSV
jgi:hypothetical protein